MDEPRPDPAASASPSVDASAAGGVSPGAAAPGLREQVGRTRASVVRLVQAHRELAQAELGDILDEVKSVAVLGGIAVGALILAALIFGIGLPLFIGEWLFGSIGWGVIHAPLFLVAIAVTCVAVAFGASAGAVGRDLLIAVLIGVVVGLVLAFDATNRAWSIIGDRMIPLNPADSRPVAAAILVLPVVFAILLGIARLIAVVRSGPAHAYETTPGFGASAAAALPAAVLIGWLTAFVAAYSYGATGFTAPLIGLGVVIVVDVILGILGRWRSLGGFIGGASAGAVLGAVVGVFTAIAFGPRVGAALGVTAALIVWPALVSLTLYRTGFDTERLKERFYPSETIDTTKETIEWVRERMPLGRRS